MVTKDNLVDDYVEKVNTVKFHLNEKTINRIKKDLVKLFC